MTALRSIALGLIVALAWCGMSAAQMAYPPPQAVDTSKFATQSQISAIQAAMPAPASTVPPAETVGGAAGAAATYRRGDAVQPRITRSGRCTTAADGTCTFDWTAQGALSDTIQPIINPIYTGSGVPSCWPTAVSSTAISVKCASVSSALITLAIITAGLNPTAPIAGVSVAVTAVPNS